MSGKVARAELSEASAGALEAGTRDTLQGLAKIHHITGMITRLSSALVGAQAAQDALAFRDAIEEAEVMASILRDFFHNSGEDLATWPGWISQIMDLTELVAGEVGREED